MSISKLDKSMRAVIVAAGTFLLAGCGVGSGTGDLEQFVQTTLSRTPGPIEPLPEFVAYEPFTYSASTLRSPFNSPMDELLAEEDDRVEAVAPDDSRPREFLEGFALSTLRMKGTIARDGVRWALIQDADLNIHRVTVGNYLGRNHGQIDAVTEFEVELTEIVPSGNGIWVERPQTIPLEDE